MKIYKLISLLILFFYLFISKVNAYEINIKGLNKYSLSDIQAITTVDINKKDLNINEINKIISEIYSSDLIYNLSSKFEKNIVLLNLEENKIINNIYFNGNFYIKDEQLLQILTTKEDLFFNKSIIQSDISSITNIYASAGYKDIEITAITEKLNEDKINVIFNINENEPSKIIRIKFLGNSYFSGKFLNNHINTKAKKFFNLFSSNSNFEPSSFQLDINKLKTLYEDHGFFDVDVNFKLEESFNNNFILVYYINERDQYNLNKINFNEKILENDVKKIIEDANFLLDKNNGFFSKSLIDNLLINLNNLLLENNIQNKIFEGNLKIINKNVNLNIITKDIKPYTVNKITINGNSITKNKTLRSKLSIQPGDHFNREVLNHNIKNLNKHSYIENVSFNNKLNDNSTLDLILDIKENSKTGNFLFGGSVSGDTGLGLFIGVNDTNIFGSGNALNTSIGLNSEENTLNIAYTQYPYKNPNLKNKYSLSSTEKDFTNSLGYKSSVDSLGYSVLFDINDKINSSIGLQYAKVDTHSSTINISPVTDNIGNYNEITINLFLNYDSTNDVLYPTSGFVNSLSLKINPPNLSDNPYIKTNYVNENYFKNEMSGNFIFNINKIGVAESYKDNLQTINAFSLGGLNFKGFDYRGVGPFQNNIYLGGNRYFNSTIGVGGSFLFDRKDNINFKLFHSLGSIWGSDYSENNEFKLRSSVGITLDILTSVIPINLSYAIPIKKYDNDKTRNFNFSIGTSF